MSTEEALKVIDAALASISANRADHALLQQAVSVLQAHLQKDSQS